MQPREQVSLVLSLLQAIVRVDGHALVMHAGDKPYVVSPTGQTDLASRGLTLEAVNGIVAQLLPVELQNALNEFGAVQHELAPMTEFPAEHFTVVAARGGDDVWTEIRRRRIPEDDRIPDEFFASSLSNAVAPPVVSNPSTVSNTSRAHQTDAIVSTTAHEDEPGDTHGPAPAAAEVIAEKPPAPADDLLLPNAGHLWPGETEEARASRDVSADTHGEEITLDVDADLEEPVAEPEPLHVQAAAQVWTPPPAPILDIASEPPASSVASADVSAPPPLIAATVEPPREMPLGVALVGPPHEAEPAVASGEPPREAPEVAASVDLKSKAASVTASVETPPEMPLGAAPVGPPREAAPAVASIEPP